MKLIHRAVAGAAVTALALLPCGLRAAYIEDFESYGVGNIDGQGPWVDFGGPITADVSTAQALSGTQSLALSTNVGGGYGSDVYIGQTNGSPITSGQWNLSFSTYVPSTFDGEIVFYHSQGAMPTTFTSGTRFRLNNLAGAALFEVQSSGGASIPLVFDQWAEVQMLINLDADTIDISYNGTAVVSDAWDKEPTGSPTIGGLNWWADNGASQGTVHIDDLSLTQIPEHSAAILGLLGMTGLATRRTRRR